MSKYDVLGGLIIVQFFTGMMGSHFGYTVNGMPEGALISSGQPGLLGVVEWVWDSMVFMFQMVSFQVDNMPAAVSVIFVVMAIMTVFVIISLVRGN